MVMIQMSLSETIVILIKLCAPAEWYKQAKYIEKLGKGRHYQNM